MTRTSEQTLSHLGFGLMLPSRPLQPYVKSYWVMQRSLPSDAWHEEYVHPEGGYGIVFNLGDDFHFDGQRLAERIFLDGSNTVSRQMAFAGCVSAIGIRFHPGGAYPFIAMPLHELNNQLAMTDAVERQPLRDLYEQLNEAPTWRARVVLIEQWLLERLRKGQEQAAIVPASLQRLHRHQGQLSIADLAYDLAISQRQLERLYKAQVGMTPVQYSRLLRVTQARTALKHADGFSLAQIGADLGFYDQSHFIRDFKAVIGMTPYRYMKQRAKKTG